MGQLDSDHGKIDWDQEHGAEARAVGGVRSQDDTWFHGGTGLPWKGRPWDPPLGAASPGLGGRGTDRAQLLWALQSCGNWSPAGSDCPGSVTTSTVSRFPSNA